jgi:hypothetical protein
MRRRTDRTPQNDNFEEPYQKGFEAYRRGVARHINPYEYNPELYGSTFWEAWFEGWDDAKNQDEIISKP